MLTVHQFFLQFFNTKISWDQQKKSLEKFTFKKIRNKVFEFFFSSEINKIQNLFI